VYIYDVATSTITARVTGHRDDVNAVTYLDETPHLIVSGSDDSLIKVCSCSFEAGVLVGALVFCFRPF